VPKTLVELRATFADAAHRRMCTFKPPTRGFSVTS